MSFWIIGKRPVIEAIKCKNVIVKEICILNNFDKSQILSSSKQNVKIKIVEKKFFTKICNISSPHQGIGALIDLKENYKKKIQLNDLVQYDEHVCLDKVSDTRNIGSVIRTCVAFGIKSIIINKRFFSYHNQNIIKSSAGAIFNININAVSNISSTIKYMRNKGYEIFSLNSSPNSNPISKIKLNKKNIFIFGSEGEGISNNILKNSDHEIKIETTNEMEHLNISNAVAAFLAIRSLIKN